MSPEKDAVCFEQPRGPSQEGMKRMCESFPKCEYGIKQTGVAWYKRFADILTEQAQDIWTRSLTFLFCSPIWLKKSKSHIYSNNDIYSLDNILIFTNKDRVRNTLCCTNQPCVTSNEL